MAAPLGWKPTLARFRDILVNSFGVRVYEHASLGAFVTQAIFTRRDDAGNLRQWVHPAVWTIRVDPILMSHALHQLGIHTGNYVNVINDLNDLDGIG